MCLCVCKHTYILTTYRPLSAKQIALEGLEKGSRDGLKIVSFRAKGMGVMTTLPIKAGEYVTDYKYKKIHHTREDKDREIEDHKANGGEGSYILEVFVGGKRIYLDATRHYKSYGR